MEMHEVDCEVVAGEDCKDFDCGNPIPWATAMWRRFLLLYLERGHDPSKLWKMLPLYDMAVNEVTKAIDAKANSLALTVQFLSNGEIEGYSAAVDIKEPATFFIMADFNKKNVQIVRPV